MISNGMRKGIFFIIVFILAIFEVTLLDSFKVFGVKPNLLLISIVIASLTFDFKQALGISVFAGILKDIFALNSFGINILLFPLSSFVVMKLSQKISLDNNYIRSVLIFIIVILNDIITRLIFISLGRFIPLGIFLGITFLEAFYTALILPLVFRTVRPLI